MAGRKSIGDLHAKVTANAQQFVSEFERADNVARRRTAAIDKEVDKLTKTIKQKFGAADIGKGLLQGLGIGSGFAAAQTAAQMVSDHYREAAESAQRIADLSEQTYKLFQERMALGQTDEQKRTQLLKEQQRIYSEMAKIQEPKFRTVTMGGPFMTASRQIAIPQSAEEEERLAALRKELEAVALAIAKYDQKDQAGTAKATDNDRERRAKALAEGLKQQEQAFDALIETQRKASDESEKSREKLDQLAEKYRDLGDPLRTYAQQIAEVNRLQGEGVLKADEVAKAIAAITAAREEARAKMVDNALTDFFGDMDEQSKRHIEGMNRVQTAAEAMKAEMNQMWNSVSDRAGQAFADMVLTGEAAFSDLTDIVARAVIEMTARLAIINPILNMLFGGVSGFGMLASFWGPGAAGATAVAGARAAGGPVEMGSSYLVGEQGPEIFTPSRSGAIIPNAAIGRGGNTYYIDARGADAGAVSRIESALVQLAGPGVVERRAMAAVSNQQRRGGGAFA